MKTQLRRILLSLAVPALIGASSTAPAAAAATTAAPDTSSGSGGGGDFNVADLPADFNWESDFETLPDAESVNDGLQEEPTAFEIFPEAVDIVLLADCEVIPEKLPVDFIMAKVTERFDIEKPGMIDIAPGEVIIVSDSALDIPLTRRLDDDHGSIHRRRLRGADFTLASSQQNDEEEQSHRNLPVQICPQCRNARSWRACLKVCIPCLRLLLSLCVRPF